MSFILFRMIDVYAKWRQNYLEENPDKQLFSWLFGGLKSIPAPQDPVITLGEKGKKMGMAVVALVVLLLLASDRE